MSVIRRTKTLRLRVTDPAVPSISVRKNRGRFELRFNWKSRERYVGSYATGAQAVASGTGMIERGEVVALFSKRG